MNIVNGSVWNSCLMNGNKHSLVIPKDKSKLIIAFCYQAVSSSFGSFAIFHKQAFPKKLQCSWWPSASASRKPLSVCIFRCSWAASILGQEKTDWETYEVVLCFKGFLSKKYCLGGCLFALSWLMSGTLILEDLLKAVSPIRVHISIGFDVSIYFPSLSIPWIRRSICLRL